MFALSTCEVAAYLCISLSLDAGSSLLSIYCSNGFHNGLMVKIMVGLLTAFNSKYGKIEVRFVFRVLQTTQNSVISRCWRTEAMTAATSRTRPRKINEFIYYLRIWHLIRSSVYWSRSRAQAKYRAVFNLVSKAI